MQSPRADDRAAIVFDDLASALDAGLPLATLGGDPTAGERVLIDLASRRRVRLLPTERTVLEAGWRSGKGTVALRGRAANRRRRAEFKRAIWSALRYPLLLLLMMPLAAVATMYVIGSELAITIACIYLVLGGLILVLARKLGRGDASLERWPVLGSLLHDLRELPYLETLHSLYGAGVPILDAHRSAVAAVSQQGLRQRLTIADGMLQNGEPLRDALSQSASLDLETRSLLATGEQSGQLEDALQRALQRRQDVATRKLTGAAKLIGQVAYGLAVVGVVIIVYRFYSSYFALLTGARG